MQIVAYDFGIKHNILRRLASFGAKVTVVPANFPAEKAMDFKPDGVFFSNGPVRHSKFNFACFSLDFCSLQTDFHQPCTYIESMRIAVATENNVRVYFRTTAHPGTQDPPSKQWSGISIEQRLKANLDVHSIIRSLQPYWLSASVLTLCMAANVALQMLIICNNAALNFKCIPLQAHNSIQWDQS